MSSASPVRVLLLSQALTQGGSERQLAVTALSLDRSRFAPEVAVMREGGIRCAELANAGVPITVFPVTSLKSGLLPQIAAFRRFLREKRFDVVHCFDVPSAIFSVAIARSAGVPVVLSSTRGHRELLSPGQRRAMRVCDRLVHGIVVNCRFLSDHLTREEKIAPGKIHLCYNGVDTAHFQPAGERASLPFPPGSRVIGTICALRPEKNLTVLIEAFAQLAGRWPEAHLLVVGSGPELPRLQSLARERGVESRIHFQPSVGDTARWFRSLDIFVLPSRSEAFSNSIMEAMACGVVPVVSATGGNTELVADGRGLVFEVGNTAALTAHLQNLLGDEPRRAALSRAAAEWVSSELPLNKMAENMGAIYLSLLAKRHPARIPALNGASAAEPRP